MSDTAEAVQLMIIKIRTKTYFYTERIWLKNAVVKCKIWCGENGAGMRNGKAFRMTIFFKLSSSLSSGSRDQTYFSHQADYSPFIYLIRISFGPSLRLFLGVVFSLKNEIALNGKRQLCFCFWRKLMRLVGTTVTYMYILTLASVIVLI